MFFHGLVSDVVFGLQVLLIFLVLLTTLYCKRRRKKTHTTTGGTFIFVALLFLMISGDAAAKKLPQSTFTPATLPQCTFRKMALAQSTFVKPGAATHDCGCKDGLPCTCDENCDCNDSEVGCHRRKGGASSQATNAVESYGAFVDAPMQTFMVPQSTYTYVPTASFGPPAAPATATTEATDDKKKKAVKDGKEVTIAGPPAGYHEADVYASYDGYTYTLVRGFVPDAVVTATAPAATAPVIRQAQPIMGYYGGNGMMYNVGAGGNCGPNGCGGGNGRVGIFGRFR